MTIKNEQADYPITLPELREAIKQGKIVKLKIVETVCGFYVFAKLHGKPSQSHYLSTRRATDKPRRFRDLIRLNKLLRKIFPDGTIELEYVRKEKQKKSQIAI